MASQKEEAFACILPNFLWLGDINARHDAEWLEKEKITHVVDAANMLVEKDHKLCVLRVEVDDRMGSASALRKHFNEVNEFIEAARKQHGKKVLVHCFEGKSRSVTLVVQYLMAHHHMCLLDAWSLVKEKRKLRVNGGFMQLLMQLELEIMPHLQGNSIKLPIPARPKLSQRPAFVRKSEEKSDHAMALAKQQSCDTGAAKARRTATHSSHEFAAAEDDSGTIVRRPSDSGC